LDETKPTMNFDWQNAAVLLLVAVACGYLARLAWQSVARKKAGGCGSCSTCPADGVQAEPQVIGLSPATNGREVAAGAATHGARRA
jgi:FeoB-associated Cys-rich membrane protein